MPARTPRASHDLGQKYTDCPARLPNPSQPTNRAKWEGGWGLFTDDHHPDQVFFSAGYLSRDRLSHRQGMRRIPPHAEGERGDGRWGLRPPRGSGTGSPSSVGCCGASSAPTGTTTSQVSNGTRGPRRFPPRPYGCTGHFPQSSIGSEVVVALLHCIVIYSLFWFIASRFLTAPFSEHRSCAMFPLEITPSYFSVVVHVWCLSTKEKRMGKKRKKEAEPVHNLDSRFLCVLFYGKLKSSRFLSMYIYFAGERSNVNQYASHM